MTLGLAKYVLDEMNAAAASAADLETAFAALASAGYGVIATRSTSIRIAIGAVVKVPAA